MQSSPLKIPEIQLFTAVCVKLESKCPTKFMESKVNKSTASSVTEEDLTQQMEITVGVTTNDTFQLLCSKSTDTQTVTHVDKGVDMCVVRQLHPF